MRLQGLRSYRAASWIRRAKETDAADLDAQFIFYWIALDALYGQAEYLNRQSDLRRFLEAVELMLPLPLTFPEHVAVGVKASECLLAWPRNRHHQLRRLQELIASVAVPTDAWGSVDPRGAGVRQAAGAKLPAKIRDSNPL